MRGLKRFAGAVFLCSCFFSLSVSAQETDKYRVVTLQEQPVYSVPSEAGILLDQLPEGTDFSAFSRVYTGDAYYYLIEVGDGVGYVPYQGCFQKDCELDTSQTVPGSSIAAPGYMSLDGDLLRGSFEVMQSCYTQIPEMVRRRFESEGFVIRMTGYDITDAAYGPYGGFAGWGTLQAVFDYERKLLFLNDEYPSNVVHEMGHFVNDRLDMYSGRTANKELYAKEAAMVSDYAMENDREYFAEVFRLYVTNPEELRILSPLSYGMMEQALAEFAALP